MEYFDYQALQMSLGTVGNFESNSIIPHLIQHIYIRDRIEDKLNKISTAIQEEYQLFILR